MSTFSKSMPSLYKLRLTCKSVWHPHCNEKHNRVAMIVKILTCLWSISVFTVSVISEIDTSGMHENNKYPCTYLVVSLSPSQQQGKLKLCTLYTQSLYISALLFSRRWEGQSQIWDCVSLDDCQTWHKPYQRIDISFMHGIISWCEHWQWCFNFDRYFDFLQSSMEELDHYSSRIKQCSSWK